MNDFSAYLDPTTFGPTPPSLQLAVNRYRSNIFGGPESAELASTRGPDDAFWQALDWLGRKVEIRTAQGTRVWWGFVNAVGVAAGGMSVELSLDGLVNYMAAVYSYEQPNGATTSGITGWQQDAISIARYGQKEQLVSLSNADAAAAVLAVARKLAKRRYPQRRRALARGTRGVRLDCVGWWETLRWRYFKLLEGRITWQGAGGEQYSQSLGWGIGASNRIGFAAGGIQDVNARLGALQVDDKVVVAGSVSNNKTMTIVAPASGEQTVYTNTTISFDFVDDINDSASGLGFVQMDSFIQVQGSVGHSRYHLVDETGSDHIATKEALTGLIGPENAGPAITITQGQRAMVAEALAFELPGAASSVTVTQYGYEIYQTFTPDHAFTLDKLAIPIGKIGSPADTVQVNVHVDVAGSPGAALVGTALAAGSIAESTTWTWFDTANSVTFVAGTTYGFTVRRTGALDPNNYYTLGMVKDAYETCKAWTGSAWVNHPQGATVMFQVWGAEDTVAQIKRVITSCGQFFSGIDDRVGASGIMLNQYIDEETEALDVVETLLAYGVSDGRRLLVSVTPERVVRIEAEPTPPAQRDRWMGDGTLRHAAGGKRPRGVLPVGEWLDLDSVPVSVNATLGISPVLVEVAEYDPNGNELSLEFADDGDDDREQG